MAAIDARVPVRTAPRVVAKGKIGAKTGARTGERELSEAIVRPAVHDKIAPSAVVLHVLREPGSGVRRKARRVEVAAVRRPAALASGKTVGLRAQVVAAHRGRLGGVGLETVDERNPVVARVSASIIAVAPDRVRGAVQDHAADRVPGEGADLGAVVLVRAVTIAVAANSSSPSSGAPGARIDEPRSGSCDTV